MTMQPAVRRLPRDEALYCQRAGKRRFSGRQSARRAMRGLKDRLRAYQCEHCRDWHLTSQTERET